jgi:hypothetical protein
MPKPLSLTAKIRAFFAENDGEYLTAADAAQKFGVEYRKAYDALHELSKAAGPLMSMRVYARKPVVTEPCVGNTAACMSDSDGACTPCGRLSRLYRGAK